MVSGPIIAWQIEEEKVEVVTDFLLWAPNSLQMVTAATKSEDWQESYDKSRQYIEKHRHYSANKGRYS